MKEVADVSSAYLIESDQNWMNWSAESPCWCCSSYRENEGDAAEDKARGRGNDIKGENGCNWWQWGDNVFQGAVTLMVGSVPHRIVPKLRHCLCLLKMDNQWNWRNLGTILCWTDPIVSAMAYWLLPCDPQPSLSPVLLFSLFEHACSQPTMFPLPGLRWRLGELSRTLQALSICLSSPVERYVSVTSVASVVCLSSPVKRYKRCRCGLFVESSWALQALPVWSVCRVRLSVTSVAGVVCLSSPVERWLSVTWALQALPVWSVCRVQLSVTSVAGVVCLSSPVERWLSVTWALQALPVWSVCRVQLSVTSVAGVVCLSSLVERWLSVTWALQALPVWSVCRVRLSVTRALQEFSHRLNDFRKTLKPTSVWRVRLWGKRWTSCGGRRWSSTPWGCPPTTPSDRNWRTMRTWQEHRYQYRIFTLG